MNHVNVLSGFILPSFVASNRNIMSEPRHREWQQINDALKQWPLPMPQAPPLLVQYLVCVCEVSWFCIWYTFGPQNP